MMAASTITLQSEISLLMSPYGIDLYQDDNELPTAIYSFDDLMESFVETYESFISEEEKETVISNLEKMIATIREKL